MIKKRFFLLLKKLVGSLPACLLISTFFSVEAFAGLAIWPAVKFSRSIFKTEDSKVPDRAMLNSGIEGILGWRNATFLAGIHGDVLLAKQITDPKKTSGINMQGFGYNVGGALGFSFSRFLVSGFYDPYITFNLNQKDSLNRSISYKGSTAYGGSFCFMAKPKISVGLNVASSTYNKVKINSATVTLATKAQLTNLGYGLSLGILF